MRGLPPRKVVLGPPGGSYSCGPLMWWLTPTQTYASRSFLLWAGRFVRRSISIAPRLILRMLVRRRGSAPPSIVVEQAPDTSGDMSAPTEAELAEKRLMLERARQVPGARIRSPAYRWGVGVMTPDRDAVAEAVAAFEAGTANSQAYYAAAGRLPGVGEAVALPTVAGPIGSRHGRGFDLGPRGVCPARVRTRG
jgi:hypothetical protein